MQPLCYAPWTNLDVSVQGDLSPCCNFDGATHNIRFNSVTEYYNSDMLAQVKQQLINNQWPSQCAKCYKTEQAGAQSKRQLDKWLFADAYSKYDINDQFLPLTTSIPLGNICNLKCRSCSSGASSAWYSEQQLIASDRQLHKPTKHHTTRNFHDLINSVLDNIIHIDFPGGEPFYTGQKEQEMILSRIIKSGRAASVSLHYTTNGTILPRDCMWEYWKHFKNVDIQISIDGIYSHFEYTRYPAKWSTVYNNIKFYQSKLVEHNHQLSIAHLASIFTIYYLPEFFKWCEQEELPVPWVGRCNTPVYYSPGIVPAHSKQAVHDKIVGTGWENDVFANDTSIHLPKFKEITAQLDALRSQSFAKTFPELAVLLDMQ